MHRLVAALRWPQFAPLLRSHRSVPKSRASFHMVTGGTDVDLLSRGKNLQAASDILSVTQRPSADILSVDTMPLAPDSVSTRRSSRAIMISGSSLHHFA